MTIGNEKVMHECFPKHSRKGNGKKEIRQKQKKKARRELGVSVEIKKVKRERKNEVQKA